jgi:hypothetical protein
MSDVKEKSGIVYGLGLGMVFETRRAFKFNELIYRIMFWSIRAYFSLIYIFPKPVSCYLLTV